MIMNGEYDEVLSTEAKVADIASHLTSPKSDYMYPEGETPKSLNKVKTGTVNVVEIITTIKELQNE